MLGKRLVLVAACALIDREARMLFAQRPPGKAMAGLWELPGGKVESGELPEEAVIREMAEELGIMIEADALSPFVFASHGYPDFHLLMPVFVCRRWEGPLVPSEGQAIAWLTRAELIAGAPGYPMPPADMPLLPHLAAIL